MNAERGQLVPDPIFVIGTARSGTTWVGNLIASHPDVAAVTAPEHHGVIESHLFDHTQHALRGRLTATQFIDRYEPEDYFQGLGVPPEAFVAASADTPVDAVAHFETLMGLYASRQGARYWLEKTPRHAIYIDQIAARFPRARFVLVKRDPSRTVRGQIAAFSAPGSSHLRTVVAKALRYATDTRGVDRLSRIAGRRATVVRYEDLVRDFEGETARLQHSLGLDPCALRSDFERSTSGPRAEVQLPLSDRIVVSGCSRVMKHVPFALIRWLRIRRDAARGGRGPYYRRLAERSST
jgi:Sulfotransferase family